MKIMSLDVFSKFLWLVASATFMFSIGINDGFRYTTLFLFLLSFFILFIKFDKNNFKNEDCVLLLVFLFYGLSMLFFQYIDTHTWPIPSRPARFIIVLPVMLILFRTYDYKHFLWYGISLGSVLAFLYAFYQYRFLGYNRVDGGLPAIIFGDMGMLLGLLSLVSCIYFYIRKQKIWMLLSLFAFLCGVGASFLSQSRGGWIALPILLLFLLLKSRNLFKKRSLLFFSVLFFLSLLGSFLSANSIFEKRLSLAVNQMETYFEGGGKNNSVGLRLEMWKLAGYMFIKHPILGAGRESSFVLKKNIAEAGKVIENAIYFSHSHNEFFDALGYRGGIGFILLMAVYLVPFWLFYKRLERYKENWDVRIYALAGTFIPLCFMIFGLTAVLFVHKVAVTMYTFSITYFWVAMRMAEKKADNSSI